jgi:hypothetical protein
MFFKLVTLLTLARSVTFSTTDARLRWVHLEQNNWESEGLIHRRDNPDPPKLASDFLKLSAPRPRRFNFEQNQWEIEGLMIHRWDKPKLPKLGATFWLFRSYTVACDKKGTLNLGSWLLLGKPCGYFIPDQPVQCSDGVKMDSPRADSMWKSPLNTTNCWSTCNTYPRAVEGECEFPEENKRWLKWRVFDLEEKDPSTIPEPKPYYPRETPFPSAKLEILNGVPIQGFA